MEQRKLGKYEIRATLGRGAMGVVYEGWDPDIDRRVAIKTVRIPDDEDTQASEMLARCKREAQAAGRLNHRNIVGVFDYGQTDDLAYIVMEFVDGRTLKSLLDSGERLVPAEIVRIMTALLSGLQYSHEHGVVHRDIKPANIILTPQGGVKIADFGIARIESSNMTQTGTLLGTPAYMSPEQFMGHTVDGRTDLYSAGIVLYQLLTGERPFDGSISAIMHKALTVEPPPPSRVSAVTPQALDPVVAKALAKRPEDRFANADAFSKALHQAFAGGAPTAAVPKGKWNVRIFAIGALALVVAGGGAALYVRQRAVVQPEAPAPPTPAPPTPAPPTPTPLAPAPQTVAPLTAAPPTSAPPTPTPATSALAPPTPVPPAPSPTVPLPPTAAPFEAAVPPAAKPAPTSVAEARNLALGLPCAVVDVANAGASGGLRLSGLALPGILFDAFQQDLKRGDQPLQIATERIELGQCAALEAVANHVRRSRDANGLRIAPPGTSIAVGSPLGVTVRGVPAGTLYVDLFAADGSVRHLPRQIVPHGSAGGDVDVTAPAPGPPGRYLLVAFALPGNMTLPERAANLGASDYVDALRREAARTPVDGAEAHADVAMVSIVPARAAAQPSPLRLPNLNAQRCADIVARVQLGEALSDADRTVLQTSCRK